MKPRTFMFTGATALLGLTGAAMVADTRAADPKPLEFGNFSISLAVKDLKASMDHNTRVTAELAIAMTRMWELEAIQTLGGNGYINEYPAGRLLRDAKLYEIGAGTNEIRQMLIGRELFEGRG